MNLSYHQTRYGATVTGVPSLTVLDFGPIQHTEEAGGYASGRELHSEGVSIESPPTIDQVCSTEHVISMKPEPVSDHFLLPTLGVRGHNPQCVVTRWDARDRVSAI